jgi:hypothetical protein
MDEGSLLLFPGCGSGISIVLRIISGDFHSKLFIALGFSG